MEKTIRTLKELKEKAERSFIKNSLIRKLSVQNSPVPDTESYLDDIYELNGAISVLESHGMAKKPVSN